MMENSDILTVDGYPIGADIEYSLHQGANLISYLGEDNQSIVNTLGSYNSDFNAIIGAASAANNNSDLGWVGSLTNLRTGNGYWVIVNNNFTFQWANE